MKKKTLVGTKRLYLKSFKKINMISVEIKDPIIKYPPLCITERVAQTQIQNRVKPIPFRTQFFEKIASKLSNESTSSSHYGDWQSSLMESHMGLVERQLSTIQSNTVAMVDRINDLHRHRLNIIKMGDPILRGLDISSDWSGIAGAIFLLSPAPIFQLVGVLLSMASSLLTLAESWRGQYLEEGLDQEMDTMPTGFDDTSSFDGVYQNLNSFFSTNLNASANDESFSAATDGTSVDSDVMPRSVVDYTNAHQYINPNSESVQKLLTSSIFPDGIPEDPSLIIEHIHSYLNQSATYRTDSGGDHWATVDETANTLTGDCEDLINLEYSLILAAFNQHGISTDSLKAHAAYVTTDKGREGHVFLTYDDGLSQPIVLDPSLNTDGDIQMLDDYRAEYRVTDVFNYTNQITTISDYKALGIQTSSSLNGFFDDIVDIFTDTIPNAFLDLFVPDVSDPNAFSGMFSVNSNDSSNQTSTQFIGEAVSLLFDNFVDGFNTDIPVLSEFADLTGNGIRAVLEPIVLAFSPGNDGYGVVSDIGGALDSLINYVMGDSFDPDVNFIQQLIYNKLYGGDGNLGFGDSSATDSFDSIIDAIGVDTSDIYDRSSGQYAFFLNAGSSFLAYQADIEALLLDKWTNAETISSNDFSFVDSDSREELLNELIAQGYIVEISNRYYIDFPSFSASVGSDTANTTDAPASANSFQSTEFSTAAISPGTVTIARSINTDIKSDYSTLLGELLQDQESVVDGFFSQSLLSGSDFSNVMFASDKKGQRVMINKYNDTDFIISFSYGRALQQSALKYWSKDIHNSEGAQQIFNHRAKMNALAAQGKWSKDLEN